MIRASILKARRGFVLLVSGARRRPKEEEGIKVDPLTKKNNAYIVKARTLREVTAYKAKLIAESRQLDLFEGE